MIFKMKFKLYFLVASCLLVASCNQEKEQLVEEQDNPFCLTKELKGKTEIVSVNERPIYDELILTGKVEYNNNDLVAYKSLLEGTVVKVNFELGDYVKKGQVLAVVNSTEIQGLSQDKKAHQNQMALLKRQLKSKKELMHDEMASQAEVNELEFQLKAEQIEVDKINSTLNMYRAIGNGQYLELNQVVAKVKAKDFRSITDIIKLQTKLNLTELYKDYPFRKWNCFELSDVINPQKTDFTHKMSIIPP